MMSFLSWFRGPSGPDYGAPKIASLLGTPGDAGHYHSRVTLPAQRIIIPA
jgi:hypothetical protein